MRRTSQKWYNMQQIDMSNGKAHGERGESAASEVFGCIPHGARAYYDLNHEIH